MALVSLRPGEGTRTFLVTVYLFLVIASSIAVKAVRDGLFLDRFGALKLPYVIIGIALGIGVFVAGYIRLARRVPPTALVSGSLLLFASNLLLFWWLGRRDWEWLPPVVYVWAGMYSAIAPAQVWTLANDVFTTREAKRTFGLVGSGGIAGAIFGGGAVAQLAVAVGTVGLIGLLAGLLVVIAGVVALVGRYRLPSDGRIDEFPAPRHLRDSFRVIRASPHLRRIAGLVFVTAMATTLADWQFKAVAARNLSGDELTAFFGGFYGSVGFVSFVVQFVLTSALLRRLGLGRTILLLPFAMLLANGWLIASLALPAAILLKGADASFKHSVDRSTRELAFLPVSPGIKVHVKSAIDMVVDRFGDGTAGVVLLVLTAIAGLGVRAVAIVNVAFFALWIVLAVRLGRSYREELARSVSRGRIEATSWSEALAGAETLDTLTGMLRDGDDGLRLEVLRLAASNPNWDLGEPLRRLARDGAPEVRAHALAVLLDPREPGVPEGIDERFQDEDRSLMAECIDVLAAPDESERRRLALALLDRAGGEARGAWLALMIRRLGPEFVGFSREILARLADPVSPPSAREAAATALGLIPAGVAAEDTLVRLLTDPDDTAASAAARSAGRLGGTAALRAVVVALARPGVRDAAEAALVQRGDEVLTMLSGAAEDPAVPEPVRRRIPGAVARIGTPRALAVLEALLDRARGDDDGRAVVDALFRFRLDHPEITVVSRRRAIDLAHEAADRHGRLAALHASAVAASELAGAAVGEAMDRARAALTRALALRWPARAVLDGARSAASADPRVRANGAELLDSLLPEPLWRVVLPVLYPAPATGAPVGPAELAAALAGDDDPWLRRIGSALAAPEDHAMQLSGATSVVQRVMALRRVDVFREMPTDELSRIATLARDESVPAGRELCRQDDPPGDLFVLLGGRASVEHDGRPLGELRDGEAVGTWGLFDEEPRPFTVRAVDELRVLRIDRFGFDELLIDRPEIARTLARRMARGLRDAAGGRTGA